MLKSKFSSGDTMIEVMLAVTIFSAVAIGGLTIMSQGMAAAQRSLELTLVRHEIDTQAEALRAMHGEAIAQRGSAAAGSAVATDWQNMLSNNRIELSELSSMDAAVTSDGTDCQFPETGKIFIVDPHSLEIQTGSPQQASTYSKIRYNSSGAVEGVDGIWIEAVQGHSPGSSSAPGYTDFYIRACWAAVGQSRPATISSVVRLYEPTS